MIDLDDAAELAARDNGRLLAIARAGATVRGIADPGAWAGRAELSGDDVGALGVVVSELLAPAYGDALAQLAGRLGAPIAARLSGLEPAGRFPRAADAVLIVSVNGLERAPLEAVHRAAARGATAVVTAPKDSPVAVAAAERHVALATFEEDEPLSAWWAAVAALVAAFDGTGVLDEVADALDEAAALLGPVIEVFDNPAKQLALLNAPLLVVAVDDAAAVAAPLLAQELGAPSRWSVRHVDVRTTFTELLSYADERAVDGAGDLFYDPIIDGPETGPPTQQLVLLSGVSTRARSEDALEVAERIGTVRAVAFGPHERWSALALILLAQLSGTYLALVHD